MKFIIKLKIELDKRLKGETCLEHGCGVVWFDSGQKNIRYWKVCEKYHHAFNKTLQYSEIFPKLVVSI